MHVFACAFLTLSKLMGHLMKSHLAGHFETYILQCELEKCTLMLCFTLSCMVNLEGNHPTTNPRIVFIKNIRY